MAAEKRSVATKTWLGDILTAPFNTGNDQTPGHLLINNKPVSRVNILGVVLNKNPPDSAVPTLDLEDGTGKIHCRSFDAKQPLPVAIGDCVFLTGRPRIYNNTKYIVIETVKKISDPMWINVRKKELPYTPPAQNTTNTIENQPEPASDTTAPLTSLLNLIKQNDHGDGADYENIIRESTAPNTEQLLQNLLQNGEIFHVRPGRIKVLE